MYTVICIYMCIHRRGGRSTRKTAGVSFLLGGTWSTRGVSFSLGEIWSNRELTRGVLKKGFCYRAHLLRLRMLMSRPQFHYNKTQRRTWREGNQRPL